MAVNKLLLALGANMPAAWGSPRQTLQRAELELRRAGLRTLSVSHVYDTLPLGPGRQAPYVNAVLLLHAAVSPAALLRLVKKIERRAGRRLGARWGPRCLDIDILDYGGRRIGWPKHRRQRGNRPQSQRGRLVLPHPEMHKRAFVLAPLLEVAPHWRHPVLTVTGRTLLARLPNAQRHGIRQSLDFAAPACDKLQNQHGPRK
jgi:2-amino-4-hydroxy-6-hydroxymethyldihydropteridine diphosphokinase